MTQRPQLWPSLASAALLLASLGDHPYGYFTFLRWVVFMSACLVAWVAWESDVQPATFVFAAVAVLFNPLVPVYLDRSTWASIDVLCAVLFALSLLIRGKRTPESVRPGSLTYEPLPAPTPTPVRTRPSELALLKQLADRLSPIYPGWDARIMVLDGEQTVVLDLYPGQKNNAGDMESVAVRGQYTIRDGQWLARSLLLDDDGDPMQPAPPAGLIGIQSEDPVGAASRLVSDLVTGYRNAAGYLPTGMPQDALLLGWKPHASLVLESLTNERYGPNSS